MDTHKKSIRTWTPLLRFWRATFQRTVEKDGFTDGLRVKGDARMRLINNPYGAGKNFVPTINCMPGRKVSRFLR
jgi:hypothetical protein